MSHRGDPDYRGQFQVINRVGESSHGAFPQAIQWPDREYLGSRSEHPNRGFDLVLQIDAQPRSLIFVMGNGCDQLGFGVRVEPSRLHGKRSRNSAKT